MPLSQNPFELRLKSNVTQAAAEGFVNLLSSHNIEIDTFFSLNHDCKTIVYKFISREAKENALQIPNLDQKLSELNFQAINSIPQNFSHRDVFTRKINPAHFQLNDGETIDGKLLEFRSNLNRAVGADRVVHIHFHQDLGYGRKKHIPKSMIISFATLKDATDYLMSDTQMPNGDLLAAHKQYDEKLSPESALIVADLAM